MELAPWLLPARVQAATRPLSGAARGFTLAVTIRCRE